MHRSPQYSFAGRVACRIALVVLLAVAGAAASAQPREVRRGDLVLRSSTVASELIDAATAGRHGIERSPTTAVLNVVLLRGPNREPIPAHVTAASRSLTGVRRTIHLKEVRENGRVSYVGSYEFLPNEVIDMEITARPRQAERARALKLRYRERMRPSG